MRVMEDADRDDMLQDVNEAVSNIRKKPNQKARKIVNISQESGVIQITENEYSSLQKDIKYLKRLLKQTQDFAKQNIDTYKEVLISKEAEIKLLKKELSDLRKVK